MIAYALMEDWLTTLGTAIFLAGIVLLPSMVPVCSLWIDYVRTAFKELDSAERSLGIGTEPSRTSTKEGKLRPRRASC